MDFREFLLSDTFQSKGIESVGRIEGAERIMEGVWDIEIRGLTRVAQSWRRSTLGLLSDGTVHLDMLMTATSDYRARYYSPIFGRFISEILWSSGAVEEWERKTKRKGN